MTAMNPVPALDVSPRRKRLLGQLQKHRRPPMQVNLNDNPVSAHMCVPW